MGADVLRRSQFKVRKVRPILSASVSGMQDGEAHRLASVFLHDRTLTVRRGSGPGIHEVTLTWREGRLNPPVTGNYCRSAKSAIPCYLPISTQRRLCHERGRVGRRRLLHQAFEQTW